MEKNAVDPDPNLWFIVGFICLILMKVIHFSGAKYPGGSVQYIFFRGKISWWLSIYFSGAKYPGGSVYICTPLCAKPGPGVQNIRQVQKDLANLIDKLNNTILIISFIYI